MLESSAPHLMWLLERLSQVLKDKCVRETGVIYAPSHRADRITLQPPGVLTELKLEGQPLQDLLKLLYQAPGITPERIIEAWGSCVAIMARKSRVPGTVQKVLTSVFPKVTFRNMEGHDDRTKMAQFLAVASFHYGELYVNEGRCYLKIEGHRLGLDGRWMEGAGGAQVASRPFQAAYTDCTRLKLGRARVIDERMTALFHHQSRVLSSLVPQIDLIFSTAARAGRQFQLALLKPFDVPRAEGLAECQTYNSVWDQASDLIERSQSPPAAELTELLRSRLNSKELQGLLGFHGKVPVRYTTLIKTRHRAALLGFKSRETLERHGMSQQAKDVADLLQLQSAIR